MSTKENKPIIEITNELVINMIHDVRGQKVMLDYELAELYGYETKTFNRQVKNNIDKFPDDFRFQLTVEESGQLRWCKNSTSSSKRKFRKKEYLPYVFTEQGVYMLMTVLKGEIATKQSIALIKAFKVMKDCFDGNKFLPFQEILSISDQINKNASDIEKLKTTINKHTKQLQIVMKNFVDPTKLKQFLIMNGQQIEAEVAFESIYRMAKHSIILVDDYINIKTLKMLKICEPNIEITIYSDNVAKDGVDEETLNTFSKEKGIRITIKPTNKVFHDRFIFIDHGYKSEKGYQCGSSSKDSGNAITMIMSIEDVKYNSILLNKVGHK